MNGLCDGYPCLKIWRKDGTIVLFTKPNTGIPVVNGEIWQGHRAKIHKNWHEENFEIFVGEITLSNQ